MKEKITLKEKERNGYSDKWEAATSAQDKAHWSKRFDDMTAEIKVLMADSSKLLDLIL